MIYAYSTSQTYIWHVLYHVNLLYVDVLLAICYLGINECMYQGRIFTSILKYYIVWCYSLCGVYVVRILLFMWILPLEPAHGEVLRALLPTALQLCLPGASPSPLGLRVFVLKRGFERPLPFRNEACGCFGRSFLAPKGVLREVVLAAVGLHGGLRVLRLCEAGEGRGEDLPGGRAGELRPRNCTSLQTEAFKRLINRRVMKDFHWF